MNKTNIICRVPPFAAAAFETVPGYVEWVYMGNDIYMEVGFRRKGCDWDAVELRTGLTIACGCSIRDARKKVQKYASQILKQFDTDRYDLAVRQLEDYQEGCWL